MKIAIAVLLFGIVVCGCSEKKVATPALARVQSGEDVKWAGAYVLHIDKRDDMAVEGIKVVFAKSTCTADSGTLLLGSTEDSSDINSVTIVLTDAKVVTLSGGGTIVSTYKKLPISLHE